MLITAAGLLIAGAVLFTLFVREKDLPAPAPASPFQHLDERKAAIYENLRDLQFEFRVGKLSEEDYQKSKLELQSELAKVLAEVDRLKAELGVAVSAKAKPAAGVPEKTPEGTKCPHCGATFNQPLKYCGECGKPMAEGAA